MNLILETVPSENRWSKRSEEVVTSRYVHCARTQCGDIRTRMNLEMSFRFVFVVFDAEERIWRSNWILPYVHTVFSNIEQFVDFGLCPLKSLFIEDLKFSTWNTRNFTAGNLRSPITVLAIELCNCTRVCWIKNGISFVYST